MPRRREDSLAMEREFEKRVEAGSRQSAARNREDASRGERSRTPFLFRFLTWCGVIMLCFVAGYGGTSYMLKEFFDKRIFYQEGQDVPAPGGSGERKFQGAGILDAQKITLSLFYPKDGALLEEKADVIFDTREDNIEEAVLKLLALSGLSGGAIGAIEVKHVFRNAETVYLDFSGSFAAALNKAGAKFSTLLITGIVRTMRENFPPINKVRFLVDSKAESAGAPVDLTATWQLPQ